MVQNTVIIASRYLSLYWVRYPTGHSVLEHIDPMPGGRYFKFNILVTKATRGGVFQAQKTLINVINRVVLFRPDKAAHSVSRIEQGQRRLLSLAIFIPSSKQ